MRIQEVHIEQFASLQRQEITSLSAGANIFLGKNEAGKSTLHHFFKALFFGFVRKNKYIPVLKNFSGKTQLASGSLLLHTDALGELSLVRKNQGMGRKCELYKRSGESLSEESFYSVLAHMTPELFDTVFAFDLETLMRISSLSATEVQHALHGAVFGLGSSSPAHILKQLETRSELLLKKDGANVKAKINVLLSELDRVESYLTDTGKASEAYFLALKDKEQLYSQRDELYQRRIQLAKTIRRLERYSNLYSYFEQILPLEEQLASYGERHPQLATKTQEELEAEQGRFEASLRTQEESQHKLLLAQKNKEEYEQEISLCQGSLFEEAVTEQWDSFGKEIQSRQKSLEELAALDRDVHHRKEQFFEDLQRAGWSLEDMELADVSIHTAEQLDAFVERFTQLHSSLDLTRKSIKGIDKDIEYLEESLEDEQQSPFAEQALPSQEDLTLLSLHIQQFSLNIQQIKGQLDARDSLVKRQEESIASVSSAKFSSQDFVKNLEGEEKGNIAAYAQDCLIAEKEKKKKEEEYERLAKIVYAEEGHVSALKDEYLALAHDVNEAVLVEQKNALAHFEELQNKAQYEKEQYEQIDSSLREIVAPRENRQKSWSKFFLQGYGSFLGLFAALGMGYCAWAFSPLFLLFPPFFLLYAFASFYMHRNNVQATKQNSFFMGSSALEAALISQRTKHRTSLENIEKELRELAQAISAWGPYPLFEDGIFILQNVKHTYSYLAEQEAKQTEALVAKEKYESAKKEYNFSRKQLEVSAQTLADCRERSAAAQEKWLATLTSLGLKTNFSYTSYSFILHKLDEILNLVSKIADSQGALSSSFDKVCYVFNHALSLASIAKNFEYHLMQEQNLSAFFQEDIRFSSSNILLFSLEQLSALCSFLDKQHKHYSKAREELSRFHEEALRREERIKDSKRLYARRARLIEEGGAYEKEMEALEQEWRIWLTSNYLPKDLHIKIAKDSYPQLVSLKAQQRELSSLARKKETSFLQVYGFLHEVYRLAAASPELVDTASLAQRLYTVARSLGEKRGSAVSFIGASSSANFADSGSSANFADSGSSTNFADSTQSALPHDADLDIGAALQQLPSDLLESSLFGNARRSFEEICNSTFETLFERIFTQLQRSMEEAGRILAVLEGLSKENTVNRARLVSLRSQLEKEEERLREAQNEYQISSGQVNGYLERYALESVDSLRNSYATALSYEKLLQKKESLEAFFVPFAHEEAVSTEDLLQTFHGINIVEYEQELQASRKELEQCEEECSAVSEALGECEARIKQLETGKGHSEVWQKKHMLSAQIKSDLHKWSVFSLAKQLLLQAKSRIEQGGNHGVMSRASTLFSRISNGEYLGIVTGEAEGTYYAQVKDGSLKSVEMLSQGTREQFYLSLRLAYIQNHGLNAETVPVFMDDILVNSDAERAGHIAQVLAEFSLSNQLFYFTCHPSTAELLYAKASEASALLATKYTSDAEHTSGIMLSGDPHLASALRVAPELLSPALFSVTKGRLHPLDGDWSLAD